MQMEQAPSESGPNIDPREHPTLNSDLKDETEFKLNTGSIKDDDDGILGPRHEQNTDGTVEGIGGCVDNNGSMSSQGADYNNASVGVGSRENDEDDMEGALDASYFVPSTDSVNSRIDDDDDDDDDDEKHMTMDEQFLDTSNASDNESGTFVIDIINNDADAAAAAAAAANIYDDADAADDNDDNDYNDAYDDADGNDVIIGKSTDNNANISKNNQIPTIILSEFNSDDDDDDDDDNGPIDIRDNASDEDQFIGFDENSTPGFSDDASPLAPISLSKALATETEAINDDDDADDGDDGDDDNGDGDDDDVEGQGPSTSRVNFDDDDHDDEDHDHHHDDEYFQPEDVPKSLDVLLLEEICEEAANMTIKEALIHSLKPNVRAGLSTAHLRLSESEILALEGYCEDFIGGLIKDLLKRSTIIDVATGAHKYAVKATMIKTTAKQLSTMDVQHLKIYCDHFVHNVIAESVIDSSMIVTKQQYQAERVQELLTFFQKSEELQEYFTSLTTDIVSTALINVSASAELQDTNDDDDRPDEPEHEPTEFENPWDDQKFENHDEDFDFDDNHSFGLPLPKGSSDDERGVGTSTPKAAYGRHSGKSPHRETGDASLEFDMDWAQGVFPDIVGPERGRQRIVMRELEFEDQTEVGGNELLAPVFLAIAEENEDDNEFQGMRRKTQSIEDLCDYIEEDQEPLRKRSSSLNNLKPKRKPRGKPRPASFQETSITDAPPVEEEQEQVEEDSDQEISQSPTLEQKVFYAYDDERYRWHTIRVNNREKVLDLKLIEPYMKVITHGGVHMPTRAVIVVIAACYLPDKTKRNYDFLMEQLFFYLISTLELLATTDEYFLVYFNGGTTQSNMPALPWMKRFYQHIEGGLKKNMINMFVAHPTFWLKTVIRFAKAFVGTNFWGKLQFIKSLEELSTKIPIEFMYIPDEVIRSDPKYKHLHNL